jgi:RNA polymerase sigma-70 factor (ECF subfamily)
MSNPLELTAMGENTTARLDSWIARIREGDNAAFDELLQHFEDRLNALASKMLRGFPVVAAREQTCDVLQEAIMRLGGALKAKVARDKDLPESKTFHTADFFRLAALQVRRELLTLAERHRRRSADPLSESALPAGSTWDPEELARWSEFHEIAAALPEKAREVFELLYYDGLRQSEAAELLGVDVRTIKSRWQDARLRLGAALGGNIPGL